MPAEQPRRSSERHSRRMLALVGVALAIALAAMLVLAPAAARAGTCLVVSG
ncbi:MAG: hypothetical protein M3O25_01285 [Actinomycetota bacterium]|nr:hypothetical protein [Actinomycetota bacterium]